MKKDKYTPSVCGVGFIGDFNQNVATKNRKTGKLEILKEYDCWKQMLRRCYNEKWLKTHDFYKGCSVCEEWYNFGNFYKWIINEPNYKKWEVGKGWCLDKDIINKGNKEYSPNKCCLVPQRINCLFTKTNKKRGKYPIGVHYSLKAKHYVAQISVIKDNKKIIKFIGYFSTEQEAFKAYKIAKEQCIRKVAIEEWGKGNISEKLDKAMIKYKVEITD